MAPPILAWCRPTISGKFGDLFLHPIIGEAIYIYDHLFTKSNQPTVVQTFSKWMIWMAIESKSSASGRHVEALLVCIIVRMSLVSTLKDPPG